MPIELSEDECPICHGNRQIAKIAQKMGYRPDIAFIRVRELEKAIKEAIKDSENDDLWGPDVTIIQYLKKALKEEA